MTINTSVADACEAFRDGNVDAFKGHLLHIKLDKYALIRILKMFGKPLKQNEQSAMMKMIEKRAK